MGSEREPATDQQRNYLNPAVKIAESRCREHGARRDANERVDNVPDAIYQLNLVGDKFDYEKKQRDANHPPVRDDFQLSRQFQMRQSTQQTQRRYGRVQIYA